MGRLDEAMGMATKQVTMSLEELLAQMPKPHTAAITFHRQGHNGSHTDEWWSCRIEGSRAPYMNIRVDSYGDTMAEVAQKALAEWLQEYAKFEPWRQAQRAQGYEAL